jgi:hypothetical protein
MVALVLTSVPVSAQLVARTKVPVFAQPDSGTMVLAVVPAGDRIVQDTVPAPDRWLAVLIGARRGFVRTWQVTQMTSTGGGGTLARGLIDGGVAAEGVDVNGRFAGGFAAGITFGLLGTLIVYNSAGSNVASLPAWIPQHSPDYVAGFQQSYVTRLRDRRQGAALTGGLIGTLASVAIWWYVLTN